MAGWFAVIKICHVFCALTANGPEEGYASEAACAKAVVPWSDGMTYLAEKDGHAEAACLPLVHVPRWTHEELHEWLAGHAPGDPV